MNGQRARDAGIDLYKALLVAAMILSHTIGLLGNRSIPLQSALKSFGDVIAFPGFLLCFGYSAQLAYFSTPPLRYSRILTTSLRLLVAFYISAISYELLLNSSAFGWDRLWKTLTLSNIPPVSEFILNFPLTLIAATLLINPLNWVLGKTTRVLIVSGALLCTSLIPYALITSPQLGLLIGAPRAVFSSFPVVQYFPFFLIGMYFARRQLRYTRWFMGVSLISAGVFLVYQQASGGAIRFPPSFAWLCGSMAFALSGYFLVQYLPARSWFARLITPLGVNSLNFFLLSNILLFALGSSFPNLTAGTALAVFIALAIIGVIYFITVNTRRVARFVPEDSLATTIAPQDELLPVQVQILHSLNSGTMLKVRRDLEGHKDFILSTPDGMCRTVARDMIEPLIEQGLIDSNKKFPSATYWLTDAGRAHLNLV